MFLEMKIYWKNVSKEYNELITFKLFKQKECPMLLSMMLSRKVEQ